MKNLIKDIDMDNIQKAIKMLTVKKDEDFETWKGSYVFDIEDLDLKVFVSVYGFGVDDIHRTLIVESVDGMNWLFNASHIISYMISGEKLAYTLVQIIKGRIGDLYKTNSDHSIINRAIMSLDVMLADHRNSKQYHSNVIVEGDRLVDVSFKENRTPRQGFILSLTYKNDTDLDDAVHFSINNKFSKDYVMYVIDAFMNDDKFCYKEWRNTIWLAD